jgi:hypothetical protein
MLSNFLTINVLPLLMFTIMVLLSLSYVDKKLIVIGNAYVVHIVSLILLYNFPSNLVFYCIISFVFWYFLENIMKLIYLRTN